MTVTSQYMQYDASPSTQLPPCTAGLSPDDCLPPPGDATGDSDTRRHYARVIAGLLYVATGGLDQVGVGAGIIACLARRSCRCLWRLRSHNRPLPWLLRGGWDATAACPEV